MANSELNLIENVNENVFDGTKKFVDFDGLDYFWEKSKEYIDDADGALSGRIDTLKETVDSLGDIEGGEGLGGMIAAKIGELDVEDAAVAGEYVSSVSETDGKISVTRVALPDYTKVYDAKGAAAAAETAAKAYADDKFQVKGDYETAGAAAQALTDAKAYTDELANGQVNKNTTAIATLNGTGEGSVSKQVADAIAEVVANAPENLDTLKEIADYIASDSLDAAELSNKVTTLEGKAHTHDNKELLDTYAQTEEDLADAVAKKHTHTNKTVLDGITAEKVLAWDSAEQNAINAAATALDTYKGEMTTTLTGKADKSVVDGLVTIVGGAESGLVKDVADLKAQDVYVKANVDKQVSDAQAAAIAQAKLDAAAALEDYYKKSETYSKTEVDNLLSTNSTGDRTYAKQYTDELFGLIQFAANSDIDGIFIFA